MNVLCAKREGREERRQGVGSVSLVGFVGLVHGLNRRYSLVPDLELVVLPLGISQRVKGHGSILRVTGRGSDPRI